MERIFSFFGLRYEYFLIGRILTIFLVGLTIFCFNKRSTNCDLLLSFHVKMYVNCVIFHLCFTSPTAQCIKCLYQSTKKWFLP